MQQLTRFLSQYTKKQIESEFPDEVFLSENEWALITQNALQRLSPIFKHINNKYYSENIQNSFNYLNSDHYAMYLYLMSREAFLTLENENFASKFFYLNKIKHSLDIFYKVKLPDIFLFVHPLGTVVGNGTFQDFLAIYQGVTIGANVGELKYPNLGKNVTLFANATLIGECLIGDHVVVGANTSLISKNVPSHHLVVGNFPDNRLLPLEQSAKQKLFHT